MKRALFIAFLASTILFLLTLNRVPAISQYMFALQIMLSATCGFIGIVEG